ncbi:MAG TPA: glycosyltransferase family 4 protein [Chloroflexota bacterium]|nr:glycosyltransferase family 4 protein [Chloroflexota bacterium]
MRVLVVAGGYPPEIGGVQVASDQIARGLQRRGHDVLVVANVPGLKPRRYVHAGVRVRGVPFLLPGRKAFPFLCAYSFLALLRTLLAFRPDLIYVHFVAEYAPYLALLMPHRGSARLIISLRGNDVHLFPEQSTIMRRALQSLCAQADAVTACSASVLDDVRPYLPEQAPRLAVLRDGITPGDFSRPDPGPSHGRPYILAVARFVKKKGLPILLRAMPAVLQMVPDVDLLVVGDGPEGEHLREMVAQLNLGQRVRFLGALTNAEAIRWMMGCELFVLPSLREPLGIVNLEAMACGRAIVATRVDGVPEIVEHEVNGLLVPPDDPDALANAIVTLLRDPEKRRAMGERGRQKALTSHTWDRYVDQLLDLYQPHVHALRRATKYES